MSKLVYNSAGKVIGTFTALKVAEPVVALPGTTLYVAELGANQKWMPCGHKSNVARGGVLCHKCFVKAKRS